MNYSNPSSEQQAVYQYIMRKAPISHEATLTPYEFPGAASERYWVATTRLHGGSQKAFLTLSLPELSNKVFIGISDDFPQTFAELVGSFSAESECNDALRVGYAECIESPILNQYGWDGILMSEPTRLIENFPQTATINNEEYEFILITLITQAEHTQWRTQGYEALMSRFDRQRRDLFHFHQKTVGDTRVVQHRTTEDNAEKTVAPATKAPTTPAEPKTASKFAPHESTSQESTSQIAATPKSMSQKSIPQKPTPPKSMPQKSMPQKSMPQKTMAWNTTPYRAEAHIGRQTTVPHTVSTTTLVAARAHHYATTAQAAAVSYQTGEPELPPAAQMTTQVPKPVSNPHHAMSANPTLQHAQQIHTQQAHSQQAHAQQIRTQQVHAQQASIQQLAPQHKPSQHEPSQHQPAQHRPLPQHLQQKPQQHNPAQQLTPKPVGSQSTRNLYAGHHDKTDLSLGDIPKDPMRINLGVEPSPEFLELTQKPTTTSFEERAHKHEENPAAALKKSTMTGTQNADQHRTLIPIMQSQSQIAAHQIAAQKKAQNTHIAPESTGSNGDKTPNTPANHHTIRDNTTYNSTTCVNTAQDTRRTNNTEQAAHKTQTRAPEKITTERQKHPKNSRPHTANRAAQFAALDEASTSEWENMLSELDNDTHFSTYEKSLLELTYTATPSQQKRQRWQVVGETALGTILLTGGLFATLFFIDSQTPLASLLPGVFAVAGLITLASAFKDALGLENSVSTRALTNQHQLSGATGSTKH